MARRRHSCSANDSSWRPMPLRRNSGSTYIRRSSIDPGDVRSSPNIPSGAQPGARPKSLHPSLCNRMGFGRSSSSSDRDMYSSKASRSASGASAQFTEMKSSRTSLASLSPKGPMSIVAPSWPPGASPFVSPMSSISHLPSRNLPIALAGDQPGSNAASQSSCVNAKANHATRRSSLIAPDIDRRLSGNMRQSRPPAMKCRVFDLSR